MTLRDTPLAAIFIAAAGIAALGLAFPAWIFVLAIAVCKGVAVLGLTLLMRAGLVSFGQGLFYAIGAYATGFLVLEYSVKNAALLVAASAIATGLLAFTLGFLLSRYRDIFFAMLTLALSMILYGLLAKSASLGGTDGFNVKGVTLAGLSLSGTGRYNGLILILVLATLSAAAVWIFSRTPLGRISPGIRDNEIRTEYLGASASRAVHVYYIGAAVLAGVAGAFAGIFVGHVDPELAFWTTSGEFIVIAVLAGSANIVTPFAASIVLEVLRTFSYRYAPDTWQLVLGVIIFVLILFAPKGMSGLRKPAWLFPRLREPVNSP